jgi:hypothetical protein
LLATLKHYPAAWSHVVEFFDDIAGAEKTFTSMQDTIQKLDEAFDDFDLSCGKQPAAVMLDAITVLRDAKLSLNTTARSADLDGALVGKLDLILKEYGALEKRMMCPMKSWDCYPLY